MAVGILLLIKEETSGTGRKSSCQLPVALSHFSFCINCIYSAVTVIQKCQKSFSKSFSSCYFVIPLCVLS